MEQDGIILYEDGLRDRYLNSFFLKQLFYEKVPTKIKYFSIMKNFIHIIYE